MKDKEIIQALIDNEKPFGLMSEEMQAKAKEIGHRGFIYYTGDGTTTWITCHLDSRFDRFRTYRLRPDYEEKPEIVECEVYVSTTHINKNVKFDREEPYFLYEATAMPDFIGFKYEGGYVCVYARGYRRSGSDVIYYGMQLDSVDKYEVLTPTHVLFQRPCKESV
jgi:hypothetical protein